MKFNKLMIACGALLTTAGVIASLNLNNKQETKEKEVVSSIVATEATKNIAPVKKNIVTNLETKPEQIIFFNTEVDVNSVELTIAQLELLKNRYDDVYLVLDSPGGSVFDGGRLISYIEASTMNIHTVVYGLCASMCFQIFERGKIRYMVDRSTIMGHQASGGVMGNIKGMKHLLLFIDKEVRKLDAYIANRSGMTVEEFDELVETDLWLAADDAIQMKLADKLATINLYSESESTFNMKNELKKRNILIKNRVTTKNPLTDIY